MLFPDKKKTVSIIVGKLGKKGDHEQKPEEALGGERADLQAAAEDMLQAFKDGSPSDLVDALSSFIECHQATPQEEPKDDEDEGWGS